MRLYSLNTPKLGKLGTVGVYFRVRKSSIRCQELPNKFKAHAGSHRYDGPECRRTLPVES